MQAQTYLMMVIYCGGDNAFSIVKQPSGFTFQAKRLSAFHWLPRQECGAERTSLLTVKRTGGTSAACIPAAALGRHGFLLCHEQCVSSESKHVILQLSVLTFFFSFLKHLDEQKTGFDRRKSLGRAAMSPQW